MRASIIICTYNRSGLLRDSIESVVAQNFPADQFEIVVVDNNSSDDTANVVQEVAENSIVSIKYVFEVQQGLSYARNTGIEHAAGEIVAFTDDDIRAAKSWLAEIVAAFEIADTAAVGGPIQPIWLSARPVWLLDGMLNYLSVSDFPQAAKLGEFSPPHVPYGANMAFRKDVLKQFGMFPLTLGRIGSRLLSNEEIELGRRIHACGLRIGFASNAIIQHKIDSSRLTKKWFFRRYYWQGRSDAVLERHLAQKAYGKACELIPQFIEMGRNRNKMQLDDRLHFYYLKGYLHQHIFAGYSGTWRELRAFEKILRYSGMVRAHATASVLEVQLAARIEAMTSSLSWRLTAPLRALKDLMDRILRGSS
jgi:glycosyltransferase involved in cell wall biosynthesis